MTIESEGLQAIKSRNERLRGVVYTKIGAQFSGAQVSIEDLTLEIGRMAEVNRISNFCLGDLINYGETEYGTKYEEWVTVTGMTYHTLANIASVAKNVPISLRNEGLEYSHHVAVASLKKNEDKRWWLDKAQERNLSVFALRRSISLGKVLDDTELHNRAKRGEKGGEDKGQPNVLNDISRMNAWIREMESEHGPANQWDFTVMRMWQKQFATVHEFMDRLFNGSFEAAQRTGS